ncbi:MBL fold metallo-hydrolase [Actinoallomurus sp. CA-150999]|uniref:MBL fold metallo-hydrolase n=1 Tax=Actinoallomurus sp. CA-150999 TaxID=3239887 RepID=UPI003D8E41F3
MPEETAVARIRELGYGPEDVTHVVLTHLDFDHIGGLADFPHAVVHTTALEHHAAVAEPDEAAKFRYRSQQWEHGPQWSLYDKPGEPWLGFADALRVDGLDDRFALVPMPGHTRGHAAVVIRVSDDRLLVHAGDAFFDGSSVGLADHTGQALEHNPGLRMGEEQAAMEPSALAANHQRLANLVKNPAVQVINAHDPRVLASAVAAGPSGGS